MRLPTLLQTLIRRLRKMEPADEGSAPCDAELLRRFVLVRDEAAFEVLVWRHGGMVLGVCKRLLRNSDDMEDAFQATFLTLVRKAASVRRAASLAGWLYQVARRVALRARHQSTRHNRVTPLLEEPAARSLEHDYDWRAILDEEIAHLPWKYRQVVLLCYLEGRSTAEVAESLGQPRGTVLSWLAWARRRLANRLTQRGVAPLVAISLLTATRAAPAVGLVATTVSTALRYATGGTVSTQIAALTNGVTMILNKWTGIAATMGLVLIAGASVAYWQLGNGDDPAPKAEQPKTTAVKPEASEAQDKPTKTISQEEKKLEISRRLLSLEIDKSLARIEMLAEENRRPMIEAKKQLAIVQEKLKSTEEERELIQHVRQKLKDKLLGDKLIDEQFYLKREEEAKKQLEELSTFALSCKIKIIEQEEELKHSEKSYTSKMKRLEEKLEDHYEDLRQVERKLVKIREER